MEEVAFSFPAEISQYAKIDSLQSLKEKIANEAGTSHSSNNFYKYSLHHQKYCYAKCKMKGCRWQMRYKFSEGQASYELSTYSSLHRHIEVSSYKSAMIETYISKLPKQLELRSAKKIVTRQLKITDSSFYYFYRKVRCPKKTIGDLMSTLQRRNYHVSVLPYQLNPQELPDLLIISTPLMKKNFVKFGQNQFMSFDLTFHLIKDLSSKNVQFKLGCFMGLSNCRRLVPFGLVITDVQTKERYYEIFKSFSLMMESFSSTIITDEAASIIQCLKQLNDSQQLQVQHCLDVFHVIRNVKKKLKNKNHLHFFSELAKAENRQEFQVKLSQVLQQLDLEDQKVVEGFCKQSFRYCLSQISDCFLGLSSSDSSNQKFHDLIKTKIPFAKSYTAVVMETLDLLESLGQKCEDYRIHRLDIGQLYSCSNLGELKYYLDQRVLNLVLEQVKKSLFFNVEEFQTSFIIKDGELCHFQVEIMPDNMLKCYCGFSDKTGIVCKHILRICMIKNEPVLPYIHKRWIIDHSLIGEAKRSPKKVGKGKKTRRNRK